MGLHDDSATDSLRDRDNRPQSASPIVPRLTPAVERHRPASRRAAAPYAASTRGYYRSLSASSIGIEFAVAIIFAMLGGMWLDKRFDSSPWLLLLCLCFGFATGLRGVWRHVAAADRAAKESEG